MDVKNQAMIKILIRCKINLGFMVGIYFRAWNLIFKSETGSHVVY